MGESLAMITHTGDFILRQKTKTSPKSQGYTEVVSTLVLRTTSDVPFLEWK